MSDIHEILSKISENQNIVRNEVVIYQILNEINENSFFPRKADILKPSTDIETYDNYIDDALLQIFVNCYAIETTKRKKYNNKIKVIHKNDINSNDDYFPYFIKTCETDTQTDCHKKIEDANKKFDPKDDPDKHDPDNITNIEDINITVKKWGEIGDRFQPRKVDMTFSFNKNERKITFTYKKRRTLQNKSITSDYISYDDFIPENKLMQERKSKSDVIITLNGTKWNEKNSSKEVRNMVFIIEENYKDSYDKFMKNIKKYILSQDNEKVIAADFYRSTMICDPEKFKDQIKLFMEFINERGGLIGKINNTFKANNLESGKYIPYFYYGLNVTFFIFCDKKYIAFEVQFHTEATLNIKQKFHNDYDLQKGFDKINLSIEDFKEDDKLKNLKFLVDLNTQYNEYMKLYKNDDRNKEELINAIIEKTTGIERTKNQQFLRQFERHLRDNDIVKSFLDKRDEKESIFKNKLLIKQIIDKTTVETRLKIQIDLMKQLFISCRCIKNNKYFDYTRETYDHFNIKEMNELVTSLNCENYYHYISENYLENKYKDPKFDVKRHFKLIDFFDHDNKVRYISDLTKNGLFLEDLNKTFFKYLFEFLFGRPISNDDNVTEANKTEFITEAIKTEFNNVMNKNIGNPPFKLLSVENPIHFLV